MFNRKFNDAQKINPRNFTYNSQNNIDQANKKLSELVKNSNRKAAVALYEKIHDANAYTYNIMLNMYSHMGKIEKAEEFFNLEMNIEKSPKYIKNAQCMLLYAYTTAAAKEKNPEFVRKAKEFYPKINGAGLDQNELATTEDYKNDIMLKLYAKFGDVKNAKIHFDKIKIENYTAERKTLTQGRLLNAYANANANEITADILMKAKALYNNIDVSGLNQDVVTKIEKNRNECMLTLYAKLGAVKNATSHFEKLGNSVGKRHMSAMLTAFVNLHDKITDEHLKAAELLFHRIGEAASDSDKKNMQQIYDNVKNKIRIEAENIPENKVVTAQGPKLFSHNVNKTIDNINLYDEIDLGIELPGCTIL